MTFRVQGSQLYYVQSVALYKVTCEIEFDDENILKEKICNW